MTDGETITALRVHGYKVTGQRLAVVQVMQGADEHLTASQVFERGRRIHPGLGLTTVYRTLDLLNVLGFVRRVHLDEGCQAYAPVRER